LRAAAHWPPRGRAVKLEDAPRVSDIARDQRESEYMAKHRAGASTLELFGWDP